MNSGLIRGSLGQRVPNDLAWITDALTAITRSVETGDAFGHQVLDRVAGNLLLSDKRGGIFVEQTTGVLPGDQIAVFVVVVTPDLSGNPP